ncbi:ATP-binding cassette subfamily C protein LapB [Polymorphobacter multimanifer]|uniref:ATP-binding cassette subfamily C protein LapB n=1 Tax=Polymorphobacter multimanifer TaxID=1070431 RepID=A0A841L4P2_9SPHN|nr:ATP-binding cassette domain-containing protein [Polymorphobacter multimanifer]MBB6227617.1 ATP-binding cassette subfamily C protein LapB [Polymorphobacter multimanifer]
MTALPEHRLFEAATKAMDEATPLPAVTPPHWFWTPLWQARGLLGQVAIAAVIVNVLALATTLYSMAVFNRILPAGASASLTALTLGMMLVIAFDFGLRTVRGYFTDIAARHVDRAVGGRLFASLTDLRMADRKGSAGQLSGLLREFETLREFVASASITALADLPFLLLYIAIIAWLAPPLAIVPLVTCLVIGGVALASQPLLDRIAAAGLGQNLTKQSVLVETASGLETVKTSHAAPMLARRWALAVDHHAALSLRQRLVAALPVNLAATAQSLVYVLTLAVGVALVQDRAISLGALIAVSMLAGRCVAPLAQVAALATRLSQSRQAFLALDALIAQGAEGDGQLHRLRRPVMAGQISFRNVSFTYPGARMPALDDVSFDIAPGERVAVLGRTGSGKSTLTRLILGLYTPQSGAVLVDGADVRSLHPDDLRGNIGAVLQDVVLFSGSIADNIRLEDPLVTDADVLTASRLAGSDGFIGALPGGYDTPLADRGEGLSGGQRQSIALARALARPRPMLLLDEPTSALDQVSEAALIDRLEDQLSGQTLLIVTHRQSLLRLATRVIVMDGGRLVASGPRDAVLHSLGLPAA